MLARKMQQFLKLHNSLSLPWRNIKHLTIKSEVKKMLLNINKKIVFALCTVLNLIKVSNSFPSSSIEEQNFNGTALPSDARWFLVQPEFQNFLESQPSSFRSGRTLLQPESDLTECGGRFLTLGPGDSATLKSHRSFGLTPYPSNYLVSQR